MAAVDRSVEAMQAAADECGVAVEPYREARKHWPREGKHILACSDDDSVVVYQAFNPEIAIYAAKHQQFDGCVAYGRRMTWIKTNFLWMVYRFFEELLENALTKGGGPSCVRLQWDPDHHPVPPYTSQARRAIQMGLKGTWQDRLAAGVAGGDVRSIVDITKFVKAARPFKSEDADTLLTATERVYTVLSAAARDAIRVDEWCGASGTTDEGDRDESKTAPTGEACTGSAVAAGAASFEAEVGTATEAVGLDFTARTGAGGGTEAGGDAGAASA